MAQPTENDIGPGILDAEDVGVLSVAKTTLLDTRRAMAYAASINDANPRYFDDLQPNGVAVHPCIAFSLQWASRFRTDQKLNLRAAPFGVHASTDLRIYRPFRTGEAITTQGMVIQKRQLGPGVYAVDRYRMTSSRGELVAELYYNGITRGATLDGPDVVLDEEPGWPQLAATSAAPIWRTEIPISLHLGQQYTECAQIYNPIHTEPSVAKAAGLPDIILHGSATKAISLTHIVNQYFGGDPSRITRLCGQLRGMVLMNSTMALEVNAEENIEGEKRIHFQTLNEDGQPAISQGVVCGKP